MYEIEIVLKEEFVKKVRSQKARHEALDSRGMANGRKAYVLFDQIIKDSFDSCYNSLTKEACWECITNIFEEMTEILYNEINSTTLHELLHLISPSTIKRDEEKIDFLVNFLLEDSVNEIHMK